MFFYRGKTHHTPKRSTATMRIATLTALLAYPAGAIMQLVFPDMSPEPGLTWGEGAGFALMILALAAFCVIAPSHLQRIVGEQAKHLDEFEMELRRKSYAFAYWVFAGMTVLAALYMGLAADSGGEGLITLWAPTSYDHWNAILWGAVLYAIVLPTAYLAWAGPAPLDEDPAEASEA